MITKVQNLSKLSFSTLVIGVLTINLVKFEYILIALSSAKVEQLYFDI